MKKLTDYELEQAERIRGWLDEVPPAAMETFGKAASGVADKLQKTVPTAVFRMALDGAQKTAVRLSDRKSILKRADLDDLAELRQGPLQLCDMVADSVSRRAISLAAGSGAVFGVAGALGLIADVPVLMIQTFRAIHRIGLCYGEESLAQRPNNLPVAIFALASSNTLAEKQAALGAIYDASSIESKAWRSGVEQATHRAFAKEAAIFSVNNLGKTLAKHLGWRKAAGAVPVTGAAISGGINAWYLHDVARTARFVFQMRWLREKYGDDKKALAMLIREPKSA